MVSPYRQYLLSIAASDKLVCRRSGKPISLEALTTPASLYSEEELDDHFSLSDTKDEAWLTSSFKQFIQRHSTLKELYVEETHEKLFEQGITAFYQYPQLCFRLAVLNEIMPYQFERSLFCASMSVFESEKNLREAKSFHGLFLCALAHDLGLLNISRAAFAKRIVSGATVEGREEYQKHVEYSVALLKKQPGLDPKIIAGVEQHHERMDGSGYPKGVSGIRLNEYGQHIHLYDTVFTVYQIKFQPLGKTIADLTPIIEMNSVTHFGQIAARMLELLSDCTRSPSFIVDTEEHEKLWTHAQSMANHIVSSTERIQTFTQTVGFRHEDKKLLGLQNGFFHISLAMMRGKQRNTVLSFIETREIHGDENERAKAFEDIYFMLREICYHIDIFYRQLRFYAKECRDPNIQTAIQEALADLKGLKQEVTSETRPSC